MATRVDVNPEFFAWAIERARGELHEFSAQFSRLPQWIAGSAKPTFKQLENFARRTHVPFGFFFLPEPPREPLPIADFRTLGGAALESPSANLLDTIYLCQQRQDWYRDFCRSTGEPPLTLVGSLTTDTTPVDAAALIRDQVGFDTEQRKQCSTWSEALRQLVAHCEDAGILVMISGVVANSTRRVLDPEEFRGFCLVDQLAPVVFVNGSDSKSAQMFTLMHEVAHLWLGQGGVSNASPASHGRKKIETWCNAVAAEFLVPIDALLEELDRAHGIDDEVRRLCRIFKVSSLVVLRRLLDARILTRERFDTLYAEELVRLQGLEANKSGGGDFYNTEAVRVSRRFARALLMSTYEGNTLFRDASRLLGVKRAATLDEFALRLGVNG